MNAVLYVVMVAIWSTTWLAIHVSHGAFSPAWGAALRFVVAATLMLPLTRPRKGRAPWGLAVLVGMLGYTFNYTASYGAVSLLPSGTAAMMLSSAPLFTALWARILIPGEPLRTSSVVGLMLAVSGVAVVQKAITLPASGLAAALFYVALGTQSQALSTVVARRYGREGVDSVALTARSILMGTVGLVALAFLREGTPWGMLGAASREAWGAVVYLAVAGTCVTFTIFYLLVQRLGPILPSTAGVVCPVLALLFGAVVGGEPLTAQHGLAALLTSVGVGMTLLPARMARVPAPVNASAPARD
ncbi:MAG: EamA family transporter [Myxococcota bacterium]